MTKEVFPSQGDVITIDAEPHSGREYGGHDLQKHNIRRHMIVVSNSAYNQSTGMFVGLPITTSEKFHNNQHYKPILIIGSHGDGVKGYVCLWQIQNFDYRSRKGKIVNHVQRSYLVDLMKFVTAIIELDS